MLVEVSLCQAGTGAIDFSGNSFESQREEIIYFLQDIHFNYFGTNSSKYCCACVCFCVWCVEV
jgi:hypothetical protein